METLQKMKSKLEKETAAHMEATAQMQARLLEVQQMVSIYIYTVEPFLEDHPLSQKNMVPSDRGSLLTGSVVFKSRSFHQSEVLN